MPFRAFPEAIRQIIYTANANEALNAKWRRAMPNHGLFPNDEAAMKLISWVLDQAAREWRQPPREWVGAKTQLAALFGERFVTQ